MLNIRIRPRKNASGTKSYLVDYINPATQKRERNFFPTKYEAEDHAEKLQQKNAKLGEIAHSLDARQTLEAVMAFERLKPYGITLSTAVDYYLLHAEPRQGKIRWAALVREVIATKERADCKKRYIKALKGSLNRFATAYGDHFVNEISSKQIEQWLDSNEYKGITRKNYIRDLKIAFEIAKKNGHCPENVAKNIQLPRITESTVEILTPSQAQKLLLVAHDWANHVTRKGTVVNLVPYIAIGLFAGLRSSEIEQLDWSEIKLGAGRIEVKAEKAKTSQRRFVKISDNLMAWLRPHMKQQGPIVGAGWREHLQLIAKKAELEKWPRNAMRHSFGSHHLTAHENAAATALEMGHETTKMLFKHYRALVTKEAANAFWKILPPEKGQWMFAEPGAKLLIPVSQQRKSVLHIEAITAMDRAA
jgi:integrase